MVISNSFFSVEYDSNVIFSYSPTYVRITRRNVSLEYVNVVVSDVLSAEAVTFRLYFGGVGNTLNVDISRAVRVFGSDIELSVTGYIGDSVSGTASAYLYAISGAKKVYEIFGGSYAIRQWRGYPLTIPLLFYLDTDVYKDDAIIATVSASSENGHELTNIRVPNYDEDVVLYAEGQVYNGSEWETSNWQWNIKQGCESGEVIYLRWVDLSGLTWYWLFHINEVTTTTEENISYGRTPLREDDAINEWDNTINLKTRKKMMLGSNNVTSDEYKVLHTLVSSSIVHAYDKNTSEWYRVRIVPGDFTTPKGNYKQFEIQIELSPQTTQLQ